MIPQRKTSSPELVRLPRGLSQFEIPWADATFFALSFLLAMVCGTTGVYFFDTGISFQYAWLLSNGYQPFSDIVTPLMPLCGLLGALGFKLFGVNYLSNVLVAAFLSGIGGLAIAYYLKPVFGRRLGYGFALAFILYSLGGMGVLYYNHLALLFEAIVLTYVLKISVTQEKATSDPRFHRGALFAWASLALLTLTKWHLGLVLGGMCLVAELTALDSVAWGRDRKVRLGAIAFRVLMAAGIIAVVWLALGFPVSSFIESQRIPLRPALLKSFADYFRMNFSGPQKTASPLTLGRPLFLFLFGGAVLMTLKKSSRFRRSWRPLVLCCLAVVLDWFHRATSPDPAFDHFYFLVFLVSALVLLRDLEYGHLKKIKYSPAFLLVESAFLLTIFVFGVQYSGWGLRKMWAMESASWLERPIAIPSRIGHGFFRGVRVRDADFRLIYFLYDLRNRWPQGKFWFGPELEILYPALGLLPPRPWPLWFHTGVSVREADADRWKKAFIEAKFDVLVFSKSRMSEAKFLSGLLESDYKKVEVPSEFPLLVYTLWHKGTHVGRQRNTNATD